MKEAIKEARKERMKIEDEISKILLAFTEKTGFNITNIDILGIRNIGAGEIVGYQARIEAKL